MLLERRSWLLSCWLAGCVHPTPPPGPAPVFDPAFTGEVVIPGAEVRYYALDGATLADARAQVEARAPVDARGARHQGLTSWHVGWEAREVAGECVVATTPTIWVDLPRWAAEPAAAPWERSLWQRQLVALVDHERGHVALAEAFFSELPARLAVGGCGQVAATLAGELADLAAQQEALHGAGAAGGPAR